MTSQGHSYESYAQDLSAAYQLQHQQQYHQQPQYHQQHRQPGAADSGFYNPYTPSPHSAGQAAPPLLSPGTLSLRPSSDRPVYFTPGADTYPGRADGGASPSGFFGDAGRHNTYQMHGGQAASPLPALASSQPNHAPGPASDTISSPTDSANREKDGGRSITRSADTRSTRLVGGDALIRKPSKRAAGLLVTVTLEAIAVIALAGIVFGRITSDISNKVQDIKTVSVYLAIFVFGMIFQVVITLDAIRLKNSIQVIGVCIFNVALATAAGLEITQVRDALQSQDQSRPGIPCPYDSTRLCRAENVLYPEVQRLLIGVTAVCAAAEIPIIFWTAKLWTEFGWIVYQKIGADLRIRSMYMWYQTFIVLLKFTFFFGVGFTIFYLILVADTTDWEYGVTIAAVPLAVATLFVAAFAVRREILSLMALSLLLMLVGLVYFVYKFTQVWVPSTAAQYEYVRLTITFISAFAILSLGLTLVNGIVCLLNFREGLKQAHDSIGRFAGVRRRRGRDPSKGEVFDLDRLIDMPPAAASASASAPGTRPTATAATHQDNAHLRPKYNSGFYSEAPSAEYASPSPILSSTAPSQNLKRISLD